MYTLQYQRRPKGPWVSISGQTFETETEALDAWREFESKPFWRHVWRFRIRTD